MSTGWSWTPAEAQALTAINPNTVAVQNSANTGNNHDTPIEIDGQPAAKEIPAPKTNSRKRKSVGTDSSGSGSGSGTTAKKPKTSRAKKSKADPVPVKASTKKAQAEALLNVSSVQVDGEDDYPLPVYETCDTMRRKIRDVLKKDGLTQAGFCRAMAQTSTTDKPPQPAQLARFLSQKGLLSGNTNVVFYASYVLLEKMRIRDRKPKSKFRQEMEVIHGDEGVDVEHNFNTERFIMHVTQRAGIDRFGMFYVTGGHAPMR